MHQLGDVADKFTAIISTIRDEYLSSKQSYRPSQKNLEWRRKHKFIEQ